MPESFSTTSLVEAPPVPGSDDSLRRIHLRTRSRCFITAITPKCLVQDIALALIEKKAQIVVDSLMPYKT
jgi:hypothetical protein